MTSLLLLASALVAAPAPLPEFLPPPEGIGPEILPLSGRAFGMGGACVGLADTAALCAGNPAASAWTEKTGIYFGGTFSSSDDPAWNGRSSFPFVSAMLPIPGRIVLSGYLAGRSQVESSGSMLLDGYRGTYEWSGGLGEAYAGFSVRAADWLAFSLGARCTYGKVVSDAVLTGDLSGPQAPLRWTYRDDANFHPSWGVMLGAFLNTEAVDLGFSVTTDRTGTLEIARDFLTAATDTTLASYTIPGELSIGVSVRPVRRVVVAGDLFVRKRLTLLDSSVDDGTTLSAGTEVDLGSGFSARGGVAFTDGLWRDGSTRYTAGGSYSFGDGRARIDAGLGYELWDEDRSETSLFVCLWAAERWLGR
jgi:hypothetical protein